MTKQRAVLATRTISSQQEQYPRKKAKFLTTRAKSSQQEQSVKIIKFMRIYPRFKPREQ